MTQDISLAILDMNDGNLQNRGVPAIKKLAAELGYNKIDLFDVRQKKEIPNLNYTAYVCTGGPGDPSDKGDWGKEFIGFLDSALNHNKNHPDDSEFVFLICHSFQVAAEHWGLGKAVKRDTTIRGIHPQHIMQYTKQAPLDFIRDLNTEEPLQTFKSQEYHIIADPDAIRHHIDFLPLMGHRYDDSNMALTAFCSRDGNILATQFHPEVSPEDMKKILNGNDELEKKLQDNIRELNGADRLKYMQDNTHVLETSHNLLRQFLIRARDSKFHTLAA